MERSKHYTKNTVLALTGLIVCLVLYSLDATVVSSAMDTIVSDLGGMDFYSWPFTLYLLFSTLALPICGKLSDTFGNKPVILVSIPIFMLGSTLCAISSSMVSLSIFRSIQGIGGGGIIAGVFTIPSAILPSSRRGGYLGLLTSINGVASIMGPTVGALITDGLGWRAIFLLNIPFSIAAFCLIVCFLKRMPPERKRQGFDLKGLLMFVCSMTPLVLALCLLGDKRLDIAPELIAIIAAALVVLVVFTRVESTTANPFIPIKQVETNVVRSYLFIAFVNQALLYVAIIYLPYYFQTSIGASPIEASAIITPMLVSLLVADNITARLSVTKGYSGRIVICSLILSAVFLALIAIIGKNATYLTGTALALGLGFSIGMSMPISNSNVQTAVSRTELGRVTSLVVLSKNMGRAVGSAVFGVIFALTVTELHVFGAATILAVIGLVVMIALGKGEQTR